MIVGGGTAGCATAIALAAHGVEDVLVVDQQRHPRGRIGESVPPATRQVLERLGLWEAFLAQDHLPSVGSCASWGAPVLRYNDFLLDRQGKGWHLDRRSFDAMLVEAAAGRGAKVARGFRLRDALSVDADGFLLTFEDEVGARARVRAGFLVDATGIAAGAVRRLGVARNQLDRLALIWATIDLEEPLAVPTQALLEACRHGWWYAARLPRERMIVALAVEPADRQRFGETGTWRQTLRATEHVARWLEGGKAALVESPALETALAPSAILSRVVGERWLAVGDAASAYDPISAQGIWKALSDGEAGAGAIAAFLGGAGETPLLAYQDGVFARFRDYLRLRRHLYGLERRWPEVPFWRNRLDGP